VRALICGTVVTESAYLKTLLNGIADSFDVTASILYNIQINGQ